MAKLKVVPQNPEQDQRILKNYFQGAPSSWLGRRDRQEDSQNFWGFSSEIHSIHRNFLTPHPKHPRPHINDNQITEQLSFSIRYHGLANPLIVQRQPDNPERYWVLDGLRRLKAVGWERIPCYVADDLSTHRALALMLAIQGTVKQFTALERGLGFLALREELDIVQEVLASYLKIDRTTISKCENLASALVPEVQQLCLQDGDSQIKMMHCFQLARLQELPQVQLRLCQWVISEKWSFRRLKNEVNRILQQTPVTPISRRRKLEVENRAFKTVIHKKIPSNISDSEIKTHLAQINLELTRAWGLTDEDLADWYQRMATHLREQARARRRSAV